MELAVYIYRLPNMLTQIYASLTIIISMLADNSQQTLSLWNNLVLTLYQSKKNSLF